MLDISALLRVHVDPLVATQNDTGVCDAIERNAPVRKPAAMSAPHLPKVAGIDSTVPATAHTAASIPAPAPAAAPCALIQDRLAGWVFDLTTLHELTERLAATSTLDDALQEFLRAGASLLGARRGLVVLEPASTPAVGGTAYGPCPARTAGLGLTHAELGHIETIPRAATAYGRILDSSDTNAPPAHTPARGAARTALPDPPAASRPLTSSATSTSTRVIARSPPASATRPATPSRWRPRQPAGSARPSGSTTNRPNPRNATAVSPVSTRGTRASTWPGWSN